jgi:hypothetical protein
MTPTMADETRLLLTGVIEEYRKVRDTNRITAYTAMFFSKVDRAIVVSMKHTQDPPLEQHLYPHAKNDAQVENEDTLIGGALGVLVRTRCPN